MANNQRSYQYTFGSWSGKLIMWLFLSSLIASLLLDFPNSIFDMIQGIADQNDWLRLGISAVIIVAVSSYAVNLYPNVYVVDDGVKIDFFWSKIHIPWNHIVDVVQNKNPAYKSWSVEVTELTPLHKLYGFLYLKSFSKPCFVIFSYLPDHQKLIEKIHKQLKKMPKS